MSDKATVSFPLQNVHIHSARGKDVITVQVPEHEIEVLKVIHGEVNVQPQGDAGDEVELQASAHAEYLRMANKYRQPGNVDPVRYAFPNGARDIVAIGFDAKGAAEAAPQSSVRNHKKPKPAAPAKGEKGEK